MQPQADPTQPRGRDSSKWDRTFAELERFVRKQGRLPNNRYAPIEELRLRNWMSTQRNARTGIGTASLSTEQATRLESIPGWYW